MQVSAAVAAVAAVAVAVAAMAVVVVAAVDHEDGVHWWQRRGVQWRWQRSTTTVVGAMDR